MTVVVVMFSICCHELAHAWMALRHGDSTAADAGHLTLNPLVQMGLRSIIVLLLIGISWGQVPVAPHRLRHRYSHALVAAIGPLTNLALALVFVLLCSATVLVNSGDRVLQGHYYLFFTIGAQLNLVLFVFNLLPIPMLDGWAVFSHLFPGLNRVNQELRNGAIVIIFFAFMMGGSYVHGFAHSMVYRSVSFFVTAAGG